MKIKRTCTLLCVLTFMFSLAGCTSNEQKNNAKIDEMKRHVEEKYDKDFTVEYFHGAFDSTYENILTLSDGEHIFNVYKYDDEEQITDDYPHNIANKKLVDYLKNNTTLTSGDIYASIMLSGDVLRDYEFVLQSDIETLAAKDEVFKILTIVRVDEDIETHKEELFNIYKNVLSLNTKYVEFSVISCDNMGAQLEKSLTNMEAYYGNDWHRYSEIDAYATITDKNISSADEMMSSIEKQ